MPVKHTVNILISKYGLVFKMIAYYALSLLLFVSIAASIVSPIFGSMFEEIAATGVSAQISQFFDEFLHGESSIVDTFGAIGSTFNSIIDIVRSNNTAVVNGLAVFGVFAVLYLFVVAMSNLVCSDVINTFMNSNSRFGFTSNFIFNLKRSALYALIYLVTYLPASLVVLVLAVLTASVLIKLGALLLALPVAVLLFLVLQSLVLTVFCGWLPAVVYDKCKVGKALVEGPKQIWKHFDYCWMSMFVTMFLSFIFVVASTIFTFGVGFIIAFPTAVVAVKILELVLYYNVRGYKFYETEKMITDDKLSD